MSDNKINEVDTDWANQINKEKKETQEQKKTYHEPTFKVFISSLGMQAMIAMGKLENPLTHKSEKNLEQARFLIDTLSIIKDKTIENLDSDEKNLIEDSLLNLKMIYITERGKEEGKENYD